MQAIVKTDIGVVRSENQDQAAIFSNEKQIFMILCDGMGGHEGGVYASKITIDTFEKEFRSYIPHHKINQWFQKTINLSKQAMIYFARKNNKLLDMGTTLTAALISESNVYIYNIGDSRTYIYNGLLHQITNDHNLRNYYIKEYNYSPEEAAKILRAAALTHSLGPQKEGQVDSFIVSVNQAVEYVILTSDGIHDYISKPTFEQILASKKTLEQKSLQLIKAAIKGKSSDNMTVAIIKLGT